MRTLTVALDAIAVSGRLRAVDPAGATQLSLSMGAIGQLQPIAVVEQSDRPGSYALVSGAHRMAAARLLGWKRIDVVVIENDPDRLRLHEIDDNLYRRGLSPYDEAAFVTERAEVCERLGLIPRHGGDRRSDQSANLALRSYAEEIAEKFGISRRSMFRALSRRRQIADEVWHRIGGTWLAENGQQLDHLVAIPEAEQPAVVEALFGPVEDEAMRPKTVRAAHDRVRNVPTELPKYPDDDAKNNLAALWRKTPAKGKRSFIQGYLKEIEKIIAEVKGQ